MDRSFVVCEESSAIVEEICLLVYDEGAEEETRSKKAMPKKPAPKKAAPKKIASKKAAPKKVTGAVGTPVDALLAEGRWDDVLALTAAGSKMKKAARFVARAQAFEGKGELWPAAVWAAGATAIDKSGAAKVILARIGPRLPEDETPLDAPMAEVFSAFDEPSIPGKAIARLAEQAAARRDEIAFYAGRMLRADLTPSTAGNATMRALLQQAARRFDTSPAVLFALVGALRKTGDLEGSTSAFQRGVACLGRPWPSAAELAFERFAYRVKDNGLSLLGEAALHRCMAQDRAKDFAGMARTSAEILHGGHALTATDRVFLLVQHAKACPEIGQEREAVTSLREALATLEREKLGSLFGANPEVLRTSLARLLAGLGDIDGALEPFTILCRNDPGAGRRLWEREPLFAKEPRFAVALVGLTAPPPREEVVSQLAEARRLMREEPGEEGALVNLAVAGAQLLGDPALLAEALFLHGKRMLRSVFAKEGAALGVLERALALAEGGALSKEIKANIAAARRALD
ncbi:MAG: hypothetical protein U0359_01745 [Byssovorax sp.]